MKVFSYEDISAATGGFAADRLIGKGSHGCVYRGDLNNGGSSVAVKKRRQVSKTFHVDNEPAKLDNELHILRSLRSPNVVNLVGVCPSSVNGASASYAGKLCLVMEFMPNGSLHDHLHSSRHPPLTWKRRLLAAIHVARALRYLHGRSPAIVHRDVKSANVLFDSQWNARLADFSLAVSLSAGETLPAGTLGYIDPWYTFPAGLSTKIDVFSFGVLLMEVISGRRVLDVGFEPASIVAWAEPRIKTGRWKEIYDKKSGELSPEMEKVIRGMLYVAARCVTAAEERRPEMSEVVKRLEGLMQRRRREKVFRRVRSWWSSTAGKETPAIGWWR